MKNWLRNTLIAVPFLVGGLKGFSQNTNDEFGKYLDTAKWKTYEVHEGIKQPEYNSDKDTLKVSDTSNVEKKVMKIDPTIFNTEEKWYKEGNNYLFTKKIRKNSDYYISGKSPNQSFAQTIGMAKFREFLHYNFTEDDLKNVDKNGDKILDAQEMFNLKKTLSK